MGGVAPAVLHAAATTLQNLAFAWLIGSVLLSLWIARAKPAEKLDLHCDVARSTLLAAAVLIASQLALLLLEAAVMADVPLRQAMPAVADVLRGTHFGSVWMVGFAASAAILVLTIVGLNAGANENRVVALATALAVFAGTRSLASHAAAHGDFSFAVALDWMHLLFIGAWVGEVLVATLRVLPRFNAAVESSVAPFALALSRSATVVLIGVLATGIAKAWQSVGSPDNLIGNPYGNALTIKLLLVTIAIGLGGFNRFFVLPAIDPGRARRPAQQERPALQRFLFVLRLESIVLICVTIAAAVLSASAPPIAIP